MDGRTRPTDAEIEHAIDLRVQRRLTTDRAYIHAENAEEQAAREEQITREIERSYSHWWEDR